MVNPFCFNLKLKASHEKRTHQVFQAHELGHTKPYSGLYFYRTDNPGGRNYLSANSKRTVS
jgi:hypothetical protein